MVYNSFALNLNVIETACGRFSMPLLDVGANYCWLVCVSEADINGLRKRERQLLYTVIANLDGGRNMFVHSYSPLVSIRDGVILALQMIVGTQS
jgi:hypothetical protein